LLIKSVEFAGAVAKPNGPKPASLPEVAFSGKSNVGKSSLINRLLGRTRTPVARVSATPGKTQEINFYEVRAAGADGADASFFLVDLPGYGFARVPLSVREKWKPLMESYLGGSKELKGVVQLIDARHGPSADDRRMVRYLANLGLPTLFVLTKVDKLGKRERAPQLAKITEDLGVDADQVLPFSSKTGEGREELLKSVEALLLG
jgi:GTP-binding protein